MFDLSALPERKVFSFAVFFICFHGDRKEVTEKQMRATFFFFQEGLADLHKEIKELSWHSLLAATTIQSKFTTGEKLALSHNSVQQQILNVWADFWMVGWMDTCTIFLLLCLLYYWISQITVHICLLASSKQTGYNSNDILWVWIIVLTILKSTDISYRHSRWSNLSLLLHHYTGMPFCCW